MRRLFAALFLISLLFTSCEDETAAEKATKEKILLISNGTEPATLEIQQATGVPEGAINRALFEGLAGFHPTDDQVAEPAAAERWEANEDFTVWTFHLRPNATWSDGVPVTAHDFIFSYHRMLHPDFKAEYAGMLYYIKGAEEFNKQTADKPVDFSTVGLRAVDELTLEITLRASIPFLPEITKHTTWYPVPKHAVLAHGTMTKPRYSDWCEPGNHIGNGPFVLESRRLGHSVVTKKNPRYWDADNVKLDGITFFPIGNPYTESRMFLAGQLHKTDTVPTEMAQFAREESLPEFKFEPYLGTRFLRCNTKNELLQNKDLRLALTYAIDREQLTRVVLNGDYAPADSQVPDFGDYKSTYRVGYDFEKAKEHLAKANVGDLSGHPQITFLTTDRDSARRVAEVYQEMWKKIGVSVRIKQVEWTTYLQLQRSMDYDIADAGWIGDFLDPTTFLDMWRPGDGNNNTGWESQEYVDLLTKAELTRDVAERMKILTEAEAVVLADAAVIPTYFYAKKYFLHPDVQGWSPLLLDNHPYKHVTLEPAGN